MPETSVTVVLAAMLLTMTSAVAQAQALKTPAQSVAAGEFSPGAPLPPSKVPGFCRVSASLTPSPDSDIRIELWLPNDWNGKYLANGVGGWGGAIPYPGLLNALQRGYATSGTDTGHSGSMGAAAFALGHPEKVKDFA